jgi:hypothetical protein
MRSVPKRQFYSCAHWRDEAQPSPLRTMSDKSGDTGLQNDWQKPPTDIQCYSKDGNSMIRNVF